MFYLYKLRTATVLIVLMLMASGCLKDSCDVKTPSTIYKPVYLTLNDLRSAIKSEAPRNIEETGKIYLYGKYIFLNETGKGLHVIDNSNPSAPQKISFINVPGNLDLAVKGNIMYVDSYIDLVALDITDPTHVKETGRVRSAYPVSTYRYGYYMDTASLGVIVDFIRKDTMLVNTCNNPAWNGEYMYDGAQNVAIFSNSAKSNAPSATGKAGSTARFGLLNNYLYTVHNWYLTSYNIEQRTTPVKKNVIPVNATTETIFPYKDNLFLGTTTGMLIYDVVAPETPAYKGMYAHIRACDPVVVENDRAYVTVRGGTICNATSVNELAVLDVRNPAQPIPLKSYAMTSPYGLGINNGRLFICEGAAGLRFLDAINPVAVKTLRLLTGIEPYDVIPENDHILLVTAKDGLYQFDYTDMKAPKLLSKISIAKK